jgi:hypothetical protein
MHRRLVLALALGLGLTAPATGQQGTWEISGAARYVTHYEGHALRGSVSFAVTAALAPDGTYAVTAPACSTGRGPVLTGRWTSGSHRALRSIVRRGIRANLDSCGLRNVHVRDLVVRQRTAADGQSLTGAFTATVRYRYEIGRELETFVARVRGDYTGARTGD